MSLKPYGWEDSKMTEMPFPVKDWPNHANGVPGATNLPSMPAAPLSIPVQDPNQVVTMVPYSGKAAQSAIDSIDVEPLAMPGAAFEKVGNSERGMTDPIDSPKHTSFNWR
jgi:hypothetical protein